MKKKQIKGLLRDRIDFIGSWRMVDGSSTVGAIFAAMPCQACGIVDRTIPTPITHFDYGTERPKTTTVALCVDCRAKLHRISKIEPHEFKESAIKARLRLIIEGKLVPVEGSSDD